MCRSKEEGIRYLSVVLMCVRIYYVDIYCIQRKSTGIDYSLTL